VVDIVAGILGFHDSPCAGCRQRLPGFSIRRRLPPIFLGAEYLDVRGAIRPNVAAPRHVERRHAALMQATACRPNPVPLLIAEMETDAALFRGCALGVEALPIISIGSHWPPPSALDLKAR